MLEHNGFLVFECPFCQRLHRISSRESLFDKYWAWNGDPEAPSVMPIIEVLSTSAPNGVCRSVISRGQITAQGRALSRPGGKAVWSNKIDLPVLLPATETL